MLDYYERKRLRRRRLASRRRLRRRLVDRNASLRNRIYRRADKWETLPKGWTEESVRKFWKTITKGRKHKVSACIKKIEQANAEIRSGKRKGQIITNPGAFCASLADRIEGTDWRHEPRKRRKKRTSASFTPSSRRALLKRLGFTDREIAKVEAMRKVRLLNKHRCDCF